MSVAVASKLAHALMFEGYVLYPYRNDSLKNQKRMVFGSLYPAEWSEQSGERCGIRMEALARAEQVEITVLFLHWARREEPGQAPWLEAKERAVRTEPLVLESLVLEPLEGSALKALTQSAHVQNFEFSSEEWEKDGAHFRTETVRGWLTVSAERTRVDGVLKLRVALQNRSTAAPRSGSESAVATEATAEVAAARAELLSFGSAHLLVHTQQGELVSLLEPPEDLREAASACKNDGVWPVLVGDSAVRSTLLASPITLYDFPAVAPESPGDYCDATEMDEMLALRVRTLTEAEKEQARRTDPRARGIIDRSEGLSEAQLLSLHGAWREPALLPDVPVPLVDGPLGGPKPGDRVRLRPRAGRDIFDLALAGELATVLSLEQDFEGRRYCTVTVDADPGRDLGVEGKPGHRFFFDLDEVEAAP